MQTDELPASSDETRLLQDRIIEADAGVAPSFPPAGGENKTKALLVPSYPDFLMSYATLPGATAYRDSVKGSLYVRELKKHLGKGLEIDRALKLVTQGVITALNLEPDASTANRFQVPFHLTTGDRLLYL